MRKFHHPTLKHQAASQIITPALKLTKAYMHTTKAKTVYVAHVHNIIYSQYSSTVHNKLSGTKQAEMSEKNLT